MRLPQIVYIYSDLLRKLGSEGKAEKNFQRKMQRLWHEKYRQKFPVAASEEL